ncbi:hypothetical protein MMC13_000631 [Lambiella insularis]|nr:hypothetical protein [Lambiella insularis]
MPLHDENGHIMGYYNAVFETTQQVVSERRTKTLLSMAVAPNMQSFWSDTLQSLRLSELDFPFALLYSLDEEPRIGTAPITFLCNLQGTIGVPEGHQSAPQQGNIESSKEGFIPCFREAKTQNRPLILRKEDGSLPPALTTGLQWRGFGEPFVAVTFPLSVGNRVFGFLLVGLNSRRPSEDKSSEDFIQLLSRQLSTSMSSAALMEQAARSKAELSKQLEIRTREVEESDTKFKHMAELAPCGMYTVAPDGMIVWANTQWYEMMGHGRRPSDHYPMSFRDCIALEDVSLVEEKWHDLAVTGVKADFEFRTKKSWVNPAGDDSVEYPAWVMALAFPIKYEDGSIRSIMGCTTDISHFKWAESVQTRSRIDAEEAKMQQERFMDVTSHEMRNPLSAILQCAEAIASDLNDYLAAPNKTALLSDNLVQSNLEAAQIITLCSQHQMRIINDVLTMSKLDSKMLLVTPVAAKPIDVVKGVLKMYEGELRSHDIKTQLRFDLSYDELKIDWAFCDPSRIRQVFINVLTNAIKFTRSEPKREIIVTLGGSADKPPRDGVANLQWFASKTPSSHRKDTTSEADWGDGQILYLYFTVKDTGRGLTDEEKTRLFHRFSQASPKTHVQYGGSGLGLFISRELTELQGGEIGVVSEVGKGSTFAFYIKARRAPSQIDEGPRSGHNHKGRDKGADASTVPPAISEDGLQLDTPKYDILLVEDNVVNQKILGKRLEKAGCTVHVANHGQEALDFLRQTRFWRGNSTGKALDLILMDLEMPVMDGLTCTRRIRELQQEGEIEQHIPVIAVTANARTEQVNEAFAAGMDDIMPKPFPVAELMPKMARFTAKH